VAQSLVQCLADTDISPDLVDFPKAPYMTQLCAIYGDTLDRIKMHSTEAVQVATRSLAWLTYCKRPLTPGELQHAIAVQDVQDDSLALEEAKPSPVMINTVCVGMVIIEAESNIVRLAHHTMRDYLHSVGPDFFPYAMQNITKACLAYLSIWSVKNGPCMFKSSLQSSPSMLLVLYVIIHRVSDSGHNHRRNRQGSDRSPLPISFSYLRRKRMGKSCTWIRGARLRGRYPHVPWE